MSFFICARGVQYILITAKDNLNGFKDAIRTVFPASTKQICVVHHIRNASKYVVLKDKKEFAKDMREIYTAFTKKNAETAIDELEKK
jgi:putative transposase